MAGECHCQKDQSAAKTEWVIGGNDMKWLKWIAAGLALLIVALFIGPLVYVQLTVPKAYRTAPAGSILGRNSRITELAVIENAEKQGRRLAVVTRPIIYTDDGGEGGTGRFLIVSRGYKTDFASLPAAARLFFSPFGRYAEAAIVHDWLYAIGEPGKKREADIIFLRAMLHDGVSPVVARYFYTAVRLGTLRKGGGGYGRATEWTHGFYSSILEDDLPQACIIDPPKSAFMRTSDVISPGMPISKQVMNSYTPLIAAMLQGYDPAQAAWDEKLNSAACQDAIAPALRSLVETKFKPVLDRQKPDERAISADIIRFFLLQRPVVDTMQQKKISKPYLRAWLKSEYHLDIPDNFWCLDIRRQGILITEMTLRGQTDWPQIQCGLVGEKPAPKPAAAPDEN